MQGSISLDDVRPYTYPTGTTSWLVICGECKTRSMMFDAGNRERADFCRPWLVDAGEIQARATLARHNSLHHEVC